ncbi:hypothetical protein HA402_001193 [Bradysia odoriphaga]|nr:hypothetical protein HA402_001193 [Bradysia odoriphaga]
MDNHMPDSAFSTSSRKVKFIVSLAVYYSNFVLGVCITFLSPLVLELTNIFDSTVDQVSEVFTIILVCYLASALVCTLIFKCVNRQLIVLLLLSLITSSFFLIPSATNLNEFFVYSSLIGLGGGGYDTAQVAWIIDIWRDESSPWILTQHFAYSLGTLAPPIILANFLTNGNATDKLDTTTAHDIRIPFYIAGSLAIIAVVINIIIYLTFRKRTAVVLVTSNIQEPLIVDTSWERESIDSRSSSSGVSVTTALISRNRDSSKRKIYIIGLCCGVIGFYSALELCTQQFLPTYTHFSPMKLSPTEAAKVLFGLQLGFTIGRLVGIFLILKIQPHFIFAANLILLAISNTILYIWGGSSMTMLWVGSVMIGVGMSTVYPSLYAYIEKYLFITESVSGVITIAASCMSAIYPLIVGNSIETNPEILIYVNYASICVSSVAFSLLFSMTYVRARVGYTRI